MCKTFICALLLTLYLKSINGECPYSAPLTVTADETEYPESLSFTFSLNETKWILYNKHGKDNINLGTTSESSIFIHSVIIKDLPISYYVSANVENPPQQCDLKLAIVFTNNSSGTSRITRALNDFESNPCVSIKYLPCKNEPTLSISYSDIEDESASSVDTITYSEATLVRCNGPSDNHFRWYYGNGTEKVRGPAVTVSKSMNGTNIYCAEIATCDYGGGNINPCTLARSKIYNLKFVMKDEPTSNQSDPSVKTGGRDYSHNNVTIHEFSGYNAYLKCDGAREADYVSWYYENRTLLEISRTATILLKKNMNGTTIICKIKRSINCPEVVQNNTHCNFWVQSHKYFLRFVESAPKETEPSASAAATPAHVCLELSTHSTIANIPYKEGRLLSLYIYNKPFYMYNEEYTISLQGDEKVNIQCAQNKSQNARINIYYKKRGKVNFECADDKQINATNTYDEIVCVDIGANHVPLRRSAFVYIFNNSVTPATSTSATYYPTTTPLSEGTTSLTLDDTDGGPRKAQPLGLWAGIVVAAVLVLAAFAYAIFKWRHNASKRRSNLVLDDQVYSTSGQVQYAELQMKSASKRIQLQEENSPYAQIIGVMAPRS